MFFELLNNYTLYLELKESFLMLSELCALSQEKDKNMSNEMLLYSVKELELYIDYLERVRRIFLKHSVKSHFLLKLKNEIDLLCSTDEYSQLCKEVQKQSHTIKYAKSVTIGVNLNAQMQPFEAGVVKINETSFVSGKFIDKLLRLEFADDEFTCSAPLVASLKGANASEAAALNIALSSALNKILASSLRSWERVIRKYIINGLDKLFGILYEWRFISICTEALLTIKNKGYTLCTPIFNDYDNIMGLYHPILALSSTNKKVVSNDIEFANNRIYILTGPNQGGKSIFTQSIGIFYSMLHLGLPLPASNAVVNPVDAIQTHFIDNRKQTYQNGRLASECEEIYKINKNISNQSLFLFDEALSSTSADEAEVIAREILSAYSELGMKGVWATHLHALCKLADEKQNGKSKISNLSAELNEDSHERTFSIISGGRYGKSYASDVAQKYHLTKDEILMAREK